MYVCTVCKNYLHIFSHYYCTTEKEFLGICIHSITGNCLLQLVLVFFFLLHKEPWKLLPNLVPASFCEFRAALSQKSSATEKHRFFSPLPPPFFNILPLQLQTRAVQAASVSTALAQEANSISDKSRNNGKPVRAERLRRKVWFFLRVVAVVLVLARQVCAAQCQAGSGSLSSKSPVEDSWSCVQKLASPREVQPSRSPDNTARHSCLTLHTNRSYINPPTLTPLWHWLISAPCCVGVYLEEKPLESRARVRGHVFDLDVGETVKQQQGEAANRPEPLATHKERLLRLLWTEPQPTGVTDTLRER